MPRYMPGMPAPLILIDKLDCHPFFNRFDFNSFTVFHVFQACSTCDESSGIAQSKKVWLQLQLVRDNRGPFRVEGGEASLRRLGTGAAAAQFAYAPAFLGALVEGRMLSP